MVLYYIFFFFSFFFLCPAVQHMMYGFGDDPNVSNRDHLPTLSCFCTVHTISNVITCLVSLVFDDFIRVVNSLRSLFLYPLFILNLFPSCFWYMYALPPFNWSWLEYRNKYYVYYDLRYVRVNCIELLLYYWNHKNVRMVAAFIYLFDEACSKTFFLLLSPLGTCSPLLKLLHACMHMQFFGRLVTFLLKFRALLNELMETL